MWHSIFESSKFLQDKVKEKKLNFDYVCRFRSDLIIKTSSNIINNQILNLKENMEKARRLLGKSIPMWGRYANIKPQQSWLVIHLLKDALFVLNRYAELEDILIKLNENLPQNIEILASLVDYYSHKGEIEKAISLLDSSSNNHESLIFK